MFLGICQHNLSKVVGLEKSLKFSNLSMPDHFWDKLNDFAKENLSTNNLRAIVRNFQAFSKSRGHFIAPIWLKFGM